MENKAAFTPDTLMGALGSWNRQEQQFKDLFGQQALHDRDFQKMKLREYDRLFIRFQGSAQTTDEKALLVMLRYQCRRMEKALHPGLLRRMLRRAGFSLFAMIERRLQRARKGPAVPYSYEQIPIPTQQRKSEDRQRPRETNLEQQPRQHQHYGPDLGRRLRGDRGQHKGPSL